MTPGLRVGIAPKKTSVQACSHRGCQLGPGGRLDHPGKHPAPFSDSLKTRSAWAEGLAGGSPLPHKRSQRELPHLCGIF